jgi:hypothetical protein
VVVAPGFTIVEPLGSATGPIPLSIVKDVTFCVDQLRVVELPAIMLEGDTEILTCGVCGPGEVGAWPPVPPQPDIKRAKSETAIAVWRKAHFFFITVADKVPLPD